LMIWNGQVRGRARVGAAVCVLGMACGVMRAADAPLKSPWDLKLVKVSGDAYRCPTLAAMPKDIVASDFYSDAKKSIIDPKRQAAYEQAHAIFLQVSDETEKAADNFQKTGSGAAGACVMSILEVQAQAGAMTGSMSSNQANYVQNWTIGGLAIAYLKVRGAGPALGASPEQTAMVQAWMRKVGTQVEVYFEARREKKTTDGQNNHLYWAGFAVMATGIAADDRKLYEWGVSTFEDGVKQIQPDGTLPLEMNRGQKALHYHLFALAPLVTMAELGEANGQDFYSFDHNMLHMAVSRAMAGLVDNRYFATKAGTAQDTPEGGKIKADDVIWVTPYVRRFPDAGISTLLNQGGSKPYGYLGGMPPS